MHKKTLGSIFWAAFFVLAFTPMTWASVAGEVNKANGLYKHDRFDDSLKLYQEALGQDDKSPVIKYDLGTAFYKKGDYTKALKYLEDAANDKNVKIKPKAEYNLGNVLYKSGMEKANANVDEAIKSLQEALGQYVQVVRDDPKDADAKFNQNIVRKEIERLKQKKQQKQQQQQQNQKNQQGQQNQQSQHNQQKKQEKQQQNQQQQSQQKQQSQQQQAESQAQKQQKAQEQAEENQKEIDRKQAQDLLEDYQENEEPKKLLNYMPKKIDDRPVLKDW